MEVLPRKNSGPFKVKKGKPQSSRTDRALRKAPKSLAIKVDLNSLEVAGRFLLEVKEHLPDGMFNMLHGAIRSRDIVAIRNAALRWDVPQLYSCPSAYFVVAQAFALLTKVPYPFGGGDTEREATAYKKFLFSETLCRLTTKKLMHYDLYPNREDAMMRRVICRARALVDRVLGSPDKGLNSVIEGCRFGPGMTVCSTDSARTTPYYKLGQGVRSVTEGARPYATLAILQSPKWVSQVADIDIGAGTCKLRWETVTSCRLTFVPKDERSFRTIAIEPYGNVFVQLGVHEYLLGRLRKYAGIDLLDQSVNQRLAKFGSENWEKVDTVSTIDLSSASDCVSPGLLHRLVRPQWKAILDDLRTRSYSYKGEFTPLSKWSSMGNGYTFALETLLFWALAQACEDICETGFRAKVYGDDIIVSRATSLLVLQTLRYTGFRVNLAKTNIVGPFRESCGMDFHSGEAVRPVFLRKFSLEVPDVFVFLNTFDRKAQLVSSEFYLRLYEAIPKQFRLFSTDNGSDDTCINVSLSWLLDRRPKGVRYDRATQTLFTRRLLFKPAKYQGDDDTKYLTWLYNTRGKPYRISTLDRPVPLLSDLIDSYFCGSPSNVTVTQRHRGIFRFSSTRTPPCGGFTDRWVDSLTTLA